MQTTEEKDELLDVVRNLNLIDDTFFHVFAEDKLAVQELLQILMEDDQLEVIETHPQDSLKNLIGRSVILDALVKLSNQKLCNVEVQKWDNDDHQRRARYNGACTTTAYSKAGEKFLDVPDVAVIFISKFDFLGKGLPIYHINRVIAETGDVVYNGFTEIYVNTAVNDGSKIAKLMQYFLNTNGNVMDFTAVSRRCSEIKERTGEQNMCKSVEDYANKKVAESTTEIIKKLYQQNVSISAIAESTGKDIEEVQKIIEEC